jgi:formate hydrogenlyase subunit 3/multisubunit Na+/H+ antiporter MnhD subunit
MQTEGTSTKERPCRYCGSAVPDRFAQCSSCDWRPGLVPVAEHHLPDGSIATTFVAEHRHKIMATAMLMATLFGICMFIGGVLNVANPGLSTDADPGSFVVMAAFGVIFAMNGIAALTYTRFGKVWWGLTPGERAAAIPGLVLGTLASIVLCLVFVFSWAVLRLLPRRFDDL